ncbi:MAG TPA: type IV pilus modification protein PilV [Gammaproteobacteria bacterium]|nr:type IV pilus modification protein PilV [Gammaproteobacteria bacterium]
MRLCDQAITRTGRNESAASCGNAIRACNTVARRQCGLTLLEALIALLVLAVGLLGFMGLQVRGLAYNHDAYVRSMATVLAHDMIERVRMARANSPNEAALTQIYDAFTAGVAAGAVCQPMVAAPNHAARVAGEKICWEAQVQATLPAGMARIERRAGVNAGSPLDDIFTITIEWRDRTAPNGQPVTQVWEFQP